MRFQFYAQLDGSLGESYHTRALLCVSVAEMLLEAGLRRAKCDVTQESNPYLILARMNRRWEPGSGVKPLITTCEVIFKPGCIVIWDTFYSDALHAFDKLSRFRPAMLYQTFNPQQLLEFLINHATFAISQEGQW